MMTPMGMTNLQRGYGGDITNGADMGMTGGAGAAASQVPMTRPVQPQQSAPAGMDKQRLIASMMGNIGQGMFGGQPQIRPVNTANPMPQGGTQTPLPALMQYLMAQKMGQQNPMQAPQPQPGVPGQAQLPPMSY